MSRPDTDPRTGVDLGRSEGESEAAYKVRARSLPGSVYYPHLPPDDADPWEWCQECRMWHRHGPCF